MSQNPTITTRHPLDNVCTEGRIIKAFIRYAQHHKPHVTEEDAEKAMISHIMHWRRRSR